MFDGSVRKRYGRPTKRGASGFPRAFFSDSPTREVAYTGADRGAPASTMESGEVVSQIERALMSASSTATLAAFVCASR